MIFVLSSVHQNRVMIHKVKMASDGSNPKRKQAWDLEELKLIDGISESAVSVFEQGQWECCRARWHI